jgi:sarcosine oxidase subunit gamma
VSKHSLKPLTPLGNDNPVSVSIGNAQITELTNFAFASLAQRGGKSRPFAAAAKRLFKIKLPAPGHSTSKDDFTVFWSSPEQWFVEAPLATHEDIASILKAEFEESASITEQSGGWCRFDLDGNASTSILERLCSVDTAAMNGNAATRSVIEHIGVFLLCRKIGTHFSIYGPRSSAGSLYHALVIAAKSVA